MFGIDKSLRKRVEQSLSDKTLYNNLNTFFHTYRESHKKVYEGLDFDTLRMEINAFKESSKEERLELFEQFKKNVELVGGFVYQAETGKDACEYIASVCKKHNAVEVVKSKSMTAEEIGLNPYLEKHGIKPIETDLGEWILQLAGEAPSHMILPAIHKNRRQVARLFREFSGEDVDENEIERMVKIARKYLREHYFKAEVGISGANVAVAETGTIAIVTNEGNGRLVTTIPPVHIVILGYEKLVRTFNEALKIMRVLPKNATGQIISVYVTWIKGATDSIKNDRSCKEIHYVFLDNGRLSLFNNPMIKEALKCIRCGSCANVCQSYGIVGGHAFGHVYTGPIGVVNTALYHGLDKAKDLLKLCIGCKACSENCPAGIDIQKLIAELNAGASDKYGVDPLKHAIFSGILNKPLTFRSVAKIGSLIEKPLSEKETDHLKKNIPFMPKKHDFRVLPTLKQRTFTELFSETAPYVPNPRKRVFFYPGCAVEYMYPSVGMAMVNMLAKAGVRVDIPKRAVCCGLPAFHSGDKRSAEETVKNNIKYLGNPDTYDSFLVLCPTCGSTLKELFPETLYLMTDEFKKAEKISHKIQSLSMFLKENNLKLKIKNGLKCTYHVPCHQNRALKFSAEGMLEEMLGSSFIHLPDADFCCGFGGTFSLDFPEISKAILDKKIENILSTGADILLTDCPGCIMQIEGGLLKRGEHVKVMHLAEFFHEYVEIENE